MKKNLLLLCLLLSGMLIARDKQSINAVAGDQSFMETFGRMPGPQDAPELRVQTHLLWVEKKLRAENHHSLTAAQEQMRLFLLNQLHAYALGGKFPHNKKFRTETHPCFIDDEGNICAVGYLIEVSTGRKLAEKIDSKYRYAFISEMKDAELESWIQTSGLTADECALIQPSYAVWNCARFSKGRDSLRIMLENNIEAKRISDSASVSFYVSADGHARFTGSKGKRYLVRKTKNIIRKQKFHPGSRGMMGKNVNPASYRKADRCTLQIHASAVAESQASSVSGNSTRLQTDGHFRGIILDQRSDEAMPYVVVVALDEKRNTICGTLSDIDGHFDLRFPQGSQAIQHIEFRYVGYETISQTINVGKTTETKIRMQSQHYDTDDQCITGRMEISIAVKKK